MRNCTIMAGHTLLGIGSEISGGIRNVYMHDCVAPNSVHRLFFVKTNHRRGAFVENIHMENIATGSTLRVLEIDTEVLYQWRTLIPTYEESITRIEGIYMNNITCESAKAIYDLKGDERMPIRNVAIRNIHVGSVSDFVSHAENVEGIVAENITYDEIDPNALPELDKYTNNK